MSLTRLVIGILPQDHRFDIFIGCLLKGIKNMIHIRIDDPAAVFILQKLSELLIIFLLKFTFEYFVPTVSEIDHVDILPQIDHWPIVV